mmetsp:Transcript_7434/g.16848  ORF Transcript_7434/g.16848 Transcript_7434/m.16848 type:complete len:152 (+) Transcript_7434:134-589(+)
MILRKKHFQLPQPVEFISKTLLFHLGNNRLQNSSGSRAQQLALSTGTLDSLTCTLGKGMSLNGNTLGSKGFTSDNNLVNGLLRLGGGSGLKKRIESDGASLRGSIELIQLDQVVKRLAVSRSGRSAGELGQTTVKRLLSSLESGTGGSTTS